MRVVYLHQYFNTPDMAGGTRSYEMARRLVAAGHEVHMVTTWRDRTDRRDWFTTEEAGIQVHWLPVPYSNRMSYSERLRAFVRFAWASARKAAALPADVVFATSTPLTIILPGYFASRRHGVPLVFEIRDLWPDVPVAMGVLRNRAAIRAAYALERFAYRSSRRVVALAPGMKESVCERGVPAARVSVIPNGCDFDVFGGASEPPSEWEPESDAISLLYVGTMGPANGVEYIPRLAAELERLGGAERVRFILVGDGKQRPLAEEEAKRLGVLGRSVRFLGEMPKREAARWVSAADATLMTYAGPEILYRDSVSNKFFDSLAAGKPVIANFRGFSTLTAQEAGAGFILEEDPRKAAEQLLEIIRNPEALRRAGAAALELARRRFSRDELARELERVLLDAIAPEPAGR